MSKEKLYRFENELDRSDLLDYFYNPSNYKKIETGDSLDLVALEAILKKKRRSAHDKSRPSKWDSELVSSIHKTFSTIKRRTLTDLRFLQWLSVERFQYYVWSRWMSSSQIKKYDGIPKNAEDKKSTVNETKAEGLSFRFLGSKSSKGLASRHTFGRMIFAGDILHDEKTDSYSLAEDVFINQNCPVALFEREFGLYKNVSKAFVKIIAREGKEKIEIEAKKLNHYATTISVEAMDHENLESILS